MEGELGCASDPDLGGYEVLMPLPLDDVSSYGYRVRIYQIGGDEQVRDSESFRLVPPPDTSDRNITVVSPDADAVGVAGEQYTVKVRDEKP